MIRALSAMTDGAVIATLHIGAAVAAI